MGCLWAACLTRCNIPCVMLDRIEGEASSQPRLISIEEGGVSERFSIARLHPSAIHNALPYVLVACKANDCQPALDAIAAHITRDSVVLLLQNGLCIQQEVAARFPHSQVFCATSTEGVTRLAPFSIRHAGRGETLIGPVPGGTGQAARPDLLRPVLPFNALNIRLCEDMEGPLWRKFAINCAINPLTVIYHCRNGELEQQQAGAQQLQQCCEEIYCVQSTLAAQQGKAPLWESAQQLLQQVLQVTRATANNYSSMLQDVRAGRRSELPYLNEYLLTLADSLGVTTPLNRHLVNRVLALQQSNSPDQRH